MWYVELNGRVLTSQPFFRYDDCLAECRRLQQQGVSCTTRPVHESDL